MRQAMQASIVCYTRAVAGPEFEAMARGESSSVPSNYTGTGPYGLRNMFIELGPSHDLFDKLTSTDAERGDARRERLAQTRPSVPEVVSGFMLLLVGLTIIGLAFSIPRRANVPQIVTLVIVTVLTCASLLLIYALDRPFSGVLRIEPTEVQITAAQITEDYVENYPSSRLPCDDQGHLRP